MKFNYYYGTEADQFTFIRIPKVMLMDQDFATLSLQSKVLYGLLLDRMSLSMKNGWVDKENRVYIIYQISEIMEDLGFTKRKAIDYLAELEGFGLVEKKRRGLGLPTILYIKSFLVDKMETSRSIETVTSENDGSKGTKHYLTEADHEIALKARKNEGKRPLELVNSEIKIPRSAEMVTSGGVETVTSRGAEMGPLEVHESAPLEVRKEIPQNKTKYINTKAIEIDSNQIESNQGKIREDEINAYREIICENICYEALVTSHPYDLELIDGIVDLVLETVVSTGDTVLIASNQYPAQLVKSKLLKLNYSMVEYVITCFQENTTKVRNIKKYMLAALFNAPSTISGYYQVEVNHDMPQFARAK